MALQILEEQTPFGGLAESFGKSLGEGISKISQRERVSRGIQDISRKSQEGGGSSGLDLFSQLIKYVDPQQAQQILPLLRENLKIEDLKKDRPSSTGGEPSPQVDDRAPGVTTKTGQLPKRATDQEAERNAQTLGYDPKVLTTIDAVNQARKSIPVVTEQEVDQKTAELMRENPIRFSELEPTRDFARKELNQEVEKIKQIISQRGREVALGDATKASLNARLASIYGENNYRDDLGIIYSRMENMAEEDVESGELTPEAAGKRYGKLGQDLKRAKVELTKAGTAGIAGGPSKDLNSSIRKSRDVFKQLNSLDEFADYLQNNNGLSLPLSRTIAFPPSNELEKGLLKVKPFELESLGLEKSLSKIKPFEFGPLGADNTGKRDDVLDFRNKRSKEEAEKLIPLIGENESIYGMALEFSNKDLDENILYDTLKEASDAGKWNPSEEQQLEMVSPEPITFSLGDIFTGWLGGWFGEKQKVPTTTKIKRTLLGKR